MAKSIGSLEVSMGLSIQDFTKNLNAVGGGLNNLQKNSEVISKKFDASIGDMMGNAFVKLKNKAQSAASSMMSSLVKLITNPISVIGGALAGYGIYKIYDRAIEAFATSEELLTRIQGLSGVEGAKQIGSALGEISNKGLIAAQVAGDLATKLLGIGASSSATATLVSSFGAIASASGAKAGDVFTQLGDVASRLLGGGEVLASDFASLSSLGLPVYDALAQRLSMVTGQAVTAAQAMQMLANGSVGSRDALNALSGMRNDPKVILQAEAQSKTLKGIYANLAGEIEGFFAEFGGAIVDALDLKGFSTSLIDFVKEFRNNFDSLVPALKNIGMVLSTVRDVLFQAFRGLVQFFTTMGTGAAVNNIENIRAVVVNFAQSVMASMQSVMLAAVDILNKIIETVGGVEKFGQILGGVIKGAGIAAGAAAIFGGIGALPAALVGGTVGGVATAFTAEGGTAQIDPEEIKAKMTEAIKAMSDAINNTGSALAQGFTNQFVAKLQTSLKGNNKISDALGNVGEAFGILDKAFKKGQIGSTNYLTSLQTTTASAIAVFKREMDLGTMSVEKFELMISQLKLEAFNSLDSQLAAGLITNQEYGDSILAIQAQFDSLKPPDLSTPFKDAKLPEWMQGIVNNQSPLDIYREKLEQLNEMNALDLLGPGGFALGAAQLADELERAVGAAEAIKNPGALVAGSSAFASQVLKINNQTGSETAQQRLERLAAKANEIAEAQNLRLQEIAIATANNNPIITAQF